MRARKKSQNVRIQCKGEYIILLDTYLAFGSKVEYSQQGTKLLSCHNWPRDYSNQRYYL